MKQAIYFAKQPMQKPERGYCWKVRNYIADLGEKLPAIQEKLAVWSWWHVHKCESLQIQAGFILHTFVTLAIGLFYHTIHGGTLKSNKSLDDLYTKFWVWNVTDLGWLSWWPVACHNTM